MFLKAKSPVSGQFFHGWKNTSECLKLGFRLETVYPGSAQLFRTLQSSTRLDVNEMIERLLFLCVGFSRDLIPSLIKSLSQLSKGVAGLSSLGVAKTLESLRSKPIFPVSMGLSLSLPELRSSQDQNWYIADRPYLRDSFVGKVPLLDIPAHEAEQMEDLFNCLGLCSRKLSLCVITKTGPKGPIKLRFADTTLLQSRAPFFEAYADPPSSIHIIIRAN